MAERTLTWNARDFLDDDVADVPFVFSLPAGDRAEPETSPVEPARLVMPTAVTVWTDLDGNGSIELIPTVKLDRRNPYHLDIAGYGPTIEFVMPDQDTDLLTILRGPSSPLPARQLPDPNAVADGEVPVSQSNAWVGGRLIYRQTSAPSPPLAGSNALWIDTAIANDPILKVWDGTAWVVAHEIVDGGVVNQHLADGSVTEAKLADEAVTTRKIAPRAVEASRIAPGSVIQPLLAAGAVGTGNIQDGAVTAPKLAPNIISGGHIVDGQVGTGELADGAVTNPKLANLAVGTGNIQNVAITNQKIAGSAVDFRNLAPNSVRSAAIQDGAVGADEIAAGAVGQTKLAAGAVGIGQLHADASDRLLPTGGSTGQVLKKQSSVDGDADWEAEAAGEDAATWAEQGNNDEIPVAKLPTIPRSKLPAEAFTQYVKEASFTITIANLGLANEGRGFDRVSGGGGSASPDTWTLDGNTLTLLACEQLASSGEFSIKVHGTLPANFRERVWIVEAADGYQDILRMATATRYRHEPGDTNYPSGLTAYQEIDWASQSLDILYNRSPGSTITLSIATNPGEHLDDEVAPWARTGNTDDVPQDKIPALAAGSVGTTQLADGAVTNDKLANNAVGTQELQDDAVTNDKLDDNSVATANLNALSVTTAKLAAGAVTVPKLGADVVARLNPMGGAGGQSAQDGLVQIVSLWRYSGTVPATSELTGANLPTWGPGWSNIPTGWSAPAPQSGVGNRFRATTVATFNETTNAFDLGTWTITQETLFNTQYTADPNASPLVTTSNRVAGSRYWRTRDPNTGHWATIWNALYMGLATWTVLASVPIGVASKTEEKIVTFTQPVRTADLRFFAFQVDVRNPALNQTDISASFIVQPWNQIWVDSAASTSNNYVGGASWAVLTGPAEMIAVSAQTTLPSNVSAGASNYFGTRFKFRGNTASGQLQSVRFHEWAAINQSGYITFLYI